MYAGLFGAHSGHYDNKAAVCKEDESKGNLGGPC